MTCCLERLVLQDVDIDNVDIGGWDEESENSDGPKFLPQGQQRVTVVEWDSLEWL